MTGINFRSNFGALAAGTTVSTVAQFQQIYNDPAISSWWIDNNGPWWTIVNDPKDATGKAFRFFYPTGTVGAAGRQILFNIGAPGREVNLEYDWMFESGFDIWEAGGKIGGGILWGPNTGTRAGEIIIQWWSIYAGRGAPNPLFPLQVQKQDNSNPNH